MRSSALLDALSILFSLALPGPALAQASTSGSGGLGWLWWVGAAVLVLGIVWLLFSPRSARAGAPRRPASRSGPRG
ncbi:MAG TPA: hypothetical protein VFE30_13975 [Anaeromyxobacteraceae bacterium]|nr:hypothetical protein [Anaeromyxobacteraceae bacterium]